MPNEAYMKFHKISKFRGSARRGCLILRSYKIFRKTLKLEKFQKIEN